MCSIEWIDELDAVFIDNMPWKCLLPGSALARMMWRRPPKTRSARSNWLPSTSPWLAARNTQHRIYYHTFDACTYMRTISAGIQNVDLGIGVLCTNERLSMNVHRCQFGACVRAEKKSGPAHFDTIGTKMLNYTKQTHKQIYNNIVYTFSLARQLAGSTQMLALNPRTNAHTHTL